jgi:transcriptional regulator with XRE-family HTH domain
VKSEPQRGLGKAVRSLREKAGIDQAALAERAELPASLIAEIESGQSDPLWGDMRKLAEALGVTLENLSELAEECENGPAYGPEKPSE